jgi:hypothetical protein
MEKMTTKKKHIEEIRRKKFSIGGKRANPLTEDLHQAVKNLSAELYTTDVHFLMELIQVLPSHIFTSFLKVILFFSNKLKCWLICLTFNAKY